MPRVQSKNKGRKATEKSNAAEGSLNLEACSLPNDVQEDILTGLPVKSLFECQPVCEQRESIVEDPSFVDKHFACSLTRPGGSCMLVSFSNVDGKEDEKPEGCHFSWQKIAHVPPFPYPFKSQGVYLNGFIYWLGMSAPGVESLVRFDVASETFQMISLPTGISSILESWRLDDDDNGSSWIKQRFEVPRSHKRLKLPVPLGNVCSGDMLLVADTPSQDYLLVSFPSNRATFRKRKIKITGLPSYIEVNGVKHINFKITSHVESFVNVETRLLCIGYFSILLVV
ncbi:Uncharacterized protein TCM_034232 [Theobroma cacao]|uniref:F-box domain-containing protein n=1 Tax=Theobroma cacao TaxID=3641 RepID=A0A061FCG3_THECC|nr:Uncharacterized protein TCM_034232 [Theobroma cacao]